MHFDGRILSKYLFLRMDTGDVIYKTNIDWLLVWFNVKSRAPLWSRGCTLPLDFSLGHSTVLSSHWVVGTILNFLSSVMIKIFLEICVMTLFVRDWKECLFCEDCIGMLWLVSDIFLLRFFCCLISKDSSNIVSYFFSIPRAMSSSSGKDQFLKQFDQIVNGVKQNYSKVSSLEISLFLKMFYSVPLYCTFTTEIIQGAHIFEETKCLHFK